MSYNLYLCMYVLHNLLKLLLLKLFTLSHDTAVYKSTDCFICHIESYTYSVVFNGWVIFLHLLIENWLLIVQVCLEDGSPLPMVWAYLLLLLFSTFVVSPVIPHLSRYNFKLASDVLKFLMFVISDICYLLLCYFYICTVLQFQSFVLCVIKLTL